MAAVALALTAVLAPAARAAGSAAEPASFGVYASGAPCTFDAMVAALAKADVVFVGEEHDDDAGHVIEHLLFAGLHAARPNIALALEMFERDVQLPLDEYLAGLIAEPAFLQAARPWPNYKAHYRPMVEYCRAHHLPVIAANAPRRYANMVARGGPAALDALGREARRYMARLPIDATAPEGYEKALDTVFADTHGGSPAGMPDPRNMRAAQKFWDASMADSIARYRTKHRDTLVMHVNGSMHSDHAWGAADRLKRLNRRLGILTVSIKPDAACPALPAGKYDGAGDFVVITPAAADASAAGLPPNHPR